VEIVDGDPIAIRVAGLSALELQELSKKIAPGVLRVETQALDGSRSGSEPITIAVLTVGVAGLKVLAAWLLEERRNNHVEKTVELEYAGGGKLTKTIRIELDSSTAPHEKILTELAALTNVELPR
jgi:hypothetical protein